MKRLNTLMLLLAFVAMAFGQNVKRLERKANNGDTEAQLELAHYYRWESGEAGSREKAAYWYVQAAEHGNAKARYELGECYYNGFVVQKDVDKAFYWFKRSATGGYVDAQMFLARSYAEGKGVKKDRGLSLHWYTRAAEQGDTEAMHSLAMAYERGDEGIVRNYKLAAYWYDKMAKANPDSGNPFPRWAALRMLGLAYYEGSGLEQDYPKAFACFVEAKEECRAELGDCYYYGHGVKQDFGAAVFWYNDAVEHSLDKDKGLRGLARCYYYGYGVKQDFLAAIHLWERAGDAESAYMLGQCYEVGAGVARDIPAANNWYVTAAGKGSLDAMYLLGYRHRRGENVAKDARQAVGYYEQILAVPDGLVPKSGNGFVFKAFAKVELASIFGYGEGNVDVDVAKADSLLGEAEGVLADNLPLLLGDIYYEDGARGTPGSYEKAVGYLEKAAGNNVAIVSAAAAFVLSKCYRFGRGVPADVAKADRLLQKATDGGWTADHSISELTPTLTIEHTRPVPEAAVP